MILLVIGLLLGVIYLLYVAVTARSWHALDESAPPSRSLVPLKRVR